jgi:hypothetical protein
MKKKDSQKLSTSVLRISGGAMGIDKIPVDAETELCIIGACLKDPQNLPPIVGSLCPGDFLSSMNQAIFVAIKSLYEEKTPLDPLTLRKRLQAQGKGIEVSEIVEIEDFFIDGLNLPYHIQQLKAISKRRELLSALEEIKDPSIEFQDVALNIRGILDDCQGIEPSGLKVIGSGEILNSEGLKLLIEPFLYRGTVNLLVGPQGGKKSIFTLSIIKALLTGNPWMGKFSVITPGPVLLIDGENPRSILKDRFEKMTIEPDLPLHILHFQTIQIDRERSLYDLMRKIREIRPVLVVFDSLIRFHRQKENDSSMARVMEGFRRIANEGPAIWTIHHYKKADVPLDQKARGFTDIVAAPDIEFSLTDRGGILSFSSVKTRVAPFGPIRLRLEIDDTEMRMVYQGPEVESLNQKIIDVLRGGNQLTISEISGALNGRGIKVGINRLRSVLKGLTGKDIIAEKEKSAKSKRWVFSLNGASPVKFTASPLINKGVKPLSDPLTLNGQAEKDSRDCEALDLDSQDLADASRVEKLGSREALNESIDASRSSEKNKGGP